MPLAHFSHGFVLPSRHKSTWLQPRREAHISIKGVAALAYRARPTIHCTHGPPLRHASRSAADKAQGRSLQSPLFQLRKASLVRGNVLVGVALLAGILISHTPDLRPTLWLILPMLLAMWGTAETARCLQKRWSWYHGGVLLLLYADLMVTVLILFFLLYPYFLLAEGVH